MQNSETPIPLAYFITFTCYGTWLHGGKTSSVDKQHNIPQTDFLTTNRIRESSAKHRMLESAYLLDKPNRQIVLNAIAEVCEYREWVLLAAHVRTNHVHCVIHSIASPENVMIAIKAYASRHLAKIEVNSARKKRWTRHGSTKYLWKPEEVEAAIEYVIYEQGDPMAVFENKDRSHYAGATIIL